MCRRCGRLPARHLRLACGAGHPSLGSPGGRRGTRGHRRGPDRGCAGAGASTRGSEAGGAGSPGGAPRRHLGGHRRRHLVGSQAAAGEHPRIFAAHLDQVLWAEQHRAGGSHRVDPAVGRPAPRSPGRPVRCGRRGGRRLRGRRHRGSGPHVRGQGRCRPDDRPGVGGCPVGVQRASHDGPHSRRAGAGCCRRHRRCRAGRRVSGRLPTHAPGAAGGSRPCARRWHGGSAPPCAWPPPTSGR